MTINWGQKAYDDLDGIADYLANRTPEAAEKSSAAYRRVF